MASLTLKPFFTYYGGKWRVAFHYPPPLYSTVIEPFAGAAGYALRYFYEDVILVERDPKVAATWRYLINVSATEILALPDIEAGQHVGDLNVCEEAQLLIGWWLNKGATHPHTKLSSWAEKYRRGCNFWGVQVQQRIASQLRHIRHWSLIEGDYTDAPDIAATWFIDPPYQKAGKYYRFGSSSVDFNTLGLWCQSRNGQTIVCENVGADWLPFEPWRDIKANESKHGGKVSKEAIWLGGNQ